MKLRFSPSLSLWIVGAAVLLALGAGFVFRNAWLPATWGWVRRDAVVQAGAPQADDHGHEHADEDESPSVRLSDQARRNLGLETGIVRLQSYERTMTIPAIVVERPGRTLVTVAAPMTGVVNGVHVVKGEAVESGTLLFKLRLTHEDLVQSQAEFLQTLGQLDVERREIARLDKIAASGAVSGRTRLEREYEQEKLEAILAAKREALLLHGLTEEQVERIVQQRRLIREMQVSVPLLHGDSTLHDDAEAAHVTETSGEPAESPGSSDLHSASSQRFIVLELDAHKGEVVQAGAPLCVLADFGELYLEGLAFEQDAEELVQAANAERTVSAVIESTGPQARSIEGLEISHLASQIDRSSRALHFYVRLPNEVLRDAVRSDGRHFLTWRYKPGQRMQLRIPVETWENVIVLPVEAVAREGAEWFVFVENGRVFRRQPVHVVARDQLFAVIARDGSLFPGQSVALTSAHQLQMAIKNEAGGGADLHHGHTH